MKKFIIIIVTIFVLITLVLSILVAESRIESKVHRLSEVVFSSCVGIMIVLIIYGLASAAIGQNLIALWN